jgi:hypothetical protein
MAESIIPILQSMHASHTEHLARLLKWKEAGGKLEEDPNHETIDELINRERLAISRFASSIAHIEKATAPLG